MSTPITTNAAGTSRNIHVATGLRRGTGPPMRSVNRAARRLVCSPTVVSDNLGCIENVGVGEIEPTGSVDV